MPRRGLAPINGNIHCRKEFTRYERGVVVGFARVGVIASQIATELSLPKLTVTCGSLVPPNGNFNPSL